MNPLHQYKIFHGFNDPTGEMTFICEQQKSLGMNSKCTIFEDSEKTTPDALLRFPAPHNESSLFEFVRYLCSNFDILHFYEDSLFSSAYVKKFPAFFDLVFFRLVGKKIIYRCEDFNGLRLEQRNFLVGVCDLVLSATPLPPLSPYPKNIIYLPRVASAKEAQAHAEQLNDLYLKMESHTPDIFAITQFFENSYIGQESLKDNINRLLERTPLGKASRFVEIAREESFVNAGKRTFNFFKRQLL